MSKPKDGEPPIVMLDTEDSRNGSAEKMWAFICIAPDGTETPCGMTTAMGWTAMITSDWLVVERLRKVVRQMAQRKPKHKFILRQYAEATDIEEL